jgi:hypothetical protein
MEESDMSPEEMVCNSSRRRYDQMGNTGVDQCHVFLTCQSEIHGIVCVFIPFMVLVRTAWRWPDVTAETCHCEIYSVLKGELFCRL